MEPKTLNSVVHTCPIPGCQTVIGNARLLCWAHWQMVPRPMQDNVNYYYRRARGGASHKRACATAIKSVIQALDRQVKVAQSIRQPYKD